MDKTLPGHLDIDGIRRDENGKKIIIDDLMLPNSNYDKSIKELKNNSNNKDTNNKNLSKQDILKLRKNKDKNKSKIANHNRKKNSNKKMNKGMF